jgi:hypothetical protein
LLRRLARTGIPAPQCSRREPPINRARHYRAGANVVKVIPARLKGRHREDYGDGAADGRRIGQVDLFDNVPRYWKSFSDRTPSRPVGVDGLD